MMRSQLSVAFVSTLVALVACSSSSSSTTTSHDASAADAPGSHKDSGAHDSSPAPDAHDNLDAPASCPAPSCNLVGPAEVMSTLGIAVSVPVGTSMVETPITVETCDYSSATAGDGGANGTFPLVILYQYPFDSTMFAAERMHVMGATTVPNIGSDAYYTDDTGIGELVILAGCVEVVIQANASENELIALGEDLAPEITAGL